MAHYSKSISGARFLMANPRAQPITIYAYDNIKDFSNKEKTDICKYFKTCNDNCIIKSIKNTIIAACQNILPIAFTSFIPFMGFKTDKKLFDSSATIREIGNIINFHAIKQESKMIDWKLPSVINVIIVMLNEAATRRGMSALAGCRH